MESQFLFTYDTMKEIDFDKIETEEDLENNKTNFLYKYLGRLVVTMSSINRYTKNKEKNKQWKK